MGDWAVAGGEEAAGISPGLALPVSQSLTGLLEMAASQGDGYGWGAPGVRAPGPAASWQRSLCSGVSQQSGCWLPGGLCGLRL